MKTVIIEVSGGVVQDVYSDDLNTRFVLVDWDKGESPGDEFAGGELHVHSLTKLPPTTRKALEQLTQ